MDPEILQPHFVLIPLLCPGHLIPMVDLARLLAQHGAIVTIATTTLNAARFDMIAEREIQYGLPIRLLRLRFPSYEVGLSEGCENIDTISRDVESTQKFFTAAAMLQQPIEKYLETTQPNPSCIISDRHVPWTVNLSIKFQIPRLMFDGKSCFNFICTHNILISKIYEKVSNYLEPFVVPGLPDRIVLTKAQLPQEFNAGSVHVKEIIEEIEKADMATYGVVINTFEELEPAYVEEFRKIKGNKVWCVGPVSICNNDLLDKACRGINNKKVAINESQCLKWLDSWEPSSVVYVCLGTLNQVPNPQLMELGLGLEASNQPFIWVIKEGDESETNELKDWISGKGLDERTKERGLIIFGWAPQVLILEHKSIGVFLTHCGWNSVMEGVCAGVPMITWPFFADQFLNEKVVVQLLRIGESVGAEIDMKWGEEDKYGVVVTKEQVKKVVDIVMDVGKEGEERRIRAKRLGEIAKKSMEIGGSSYLNIEELINHIMQYVNSNKFK